MGTKSGLSNEEKGAIANLSNEKKEAIAKFLLRPFRLVRDPVHVDIWLTRLESTLVDQPLFQRLRGIRQLAVSHLVYPGAIHTRFDHSIGTLFIADKITREAQKNCGSRGYLSDLNGFYQVREHDRLLIRLVALLHDVAHVPFGHLIEDEAGFTQEKQWADAGRMDYLKRELIERGFNIFVESLRKEFASGGSKVESARSTGECDSSCRDAFRKLIEVLEGKSGTYSPGSAIELINNYLIVLPECDSSCRDAFRKLIEVLEGKSGTYSPGSAIELIEKYLFDNVLPELTSVLKAEEEGTSSIQKLNRPLIAEAVGDTICADLLDYLARDAHYTGLEERYDRRIFTYFISFNNPSNEGKPHMGLLVKKGAKSVRVDAARYIAKLLDMRYALAQMVYTHPAKRMFSAFATSMFGSWVMYEVYKDNNGAGGAGNARGYFSSIPGKVNELILKMVEDDNFNMDDALLSTLMNLDTAEKNKQPPLIDKHSLEWRRRTSALARAIRHRERWKRKRLPGFHTKIEGKERKIQSFYKHPSLNVTITTLSNLGGKGKIQLEVEIEGVLRKLFDLRFGRTGSPPEALFVLHVPKVFKPKEADVNVVLVHEDGPKRSAYAGQFKFLKSESLEKIKKMGDKGTKGIAKNQSDLVEQAESLEPMLGVLESTAEATVGLTVAEYYLHPKADGFLSKIGAEAAFTEMVALLVAFVRAPDSTDEDVLQKHLFMALEKLKDLATAAGAKDVSRLENQEELLAAHGGKSQTPTEIPPLADLFD